MKNTKYIFTATLLTALPTLAMAGYKDATFLSEVRRGVDLVVAPTVAEYTIDDAPGALGLEVYEKVDVVDPGDTRMFIPASMYVRMGGGLNLGFATDKARLGDTKFEASGGYTTQIGLGWNLSSYVRAEVDFQASTLKFSDLDNYQATYNTIGGMLNFDLARRYVQTGDITHRRTFVPFVGIGAGIGVYDFQGPGGRGGIVLPMPRAVAGFNVMFNDLIGIDIYYQYQMMIGNGFGWDIPASGVDNISNIMATFRVNF